MSEEIREQQMPLQTEYTTPPAERAVPRPNPRRRRRKRRHPYAHLVKPALILLAVLAVVILAVVDYNSYELQVSATEQMTLEYGHAFTPPEAEAVMKGGLLFKTEEDAVVTVEGEVDVNKLGRQELTYQIRSEASWLFFSRTLETSVKLVVTVQDTVPPQITLLKAEAPTTYPGQDYVEEGFTVTDNVDGDLSHLVTKEQIGDQVVYSVTDSSGNTVTVTRDIEYIKGPPPEGKAIYLTFDDGPGIYTEELLDVLAKYNVKATFFVVGTDYPQIMTRIAEEGHAIGIHSYSHRLKEIYVSEEAFFADVEKMQELVVQYTGQRSNLLRFPGGSSNSLSRYNPGIMTRLSTAVVEQGYYYFDWNVDSMDAGTATTAEEVYENVITGVQSRKNSVVLQHDIKEFSVDAVEQIIIWGLENGYVFLPLDEYAPGCHHKIYN